ncbi:MAG: CrcB family protein [Actinomycetota bacterium]
MIVALWAVAFVALAAAGSCLRFLVGRYVNGDFPWGTLTVNITAAFALGLLHDADPVVQTVVGIGALGAFSTWSTVANEVAELGRDGLGAQAVLYLMATTTIGVVAAWVGLQASGSIGL